MSILEVGTLCSSRFLSYQQKTNNKILYRKENQWLTWQCLLRIFSFFSLINSCFSFRANQVLNQFWIFFNECFLAWNSFNVIWCKKNKKRDQNLKISKSTKHTFSRALCSQIGFFPSEKNEYLIFWFSWFVFVGSFT